MGFPNQRNRNTTHIKQDKKNYNDKSIYENPTENKTSGKDIIKNVKDVLKTVERVILHYL